MLINRTKKMEPQAPANDLTARIAQLRSDIESTHRELAEAREEADQLNVDAIIHGGHFDASLGAKADLLSQKLTGLQKTLGPLEVADRKQQADAAAVAAKAEAERIEAIRSHYRIEVGRMITATLAAVAAHARAHEVFLQLGERPEQEMGMPAHPDVPEGIASWKRAIFQFGYGDLLPADDPAAALYREELAFDAEFSRRKQAYHARQLRAECGALVQDEEPTEIPNRQPWGRGRQKAADRGAIAV